MSVFTSQIRHKPWLWQVTLLCGVLGALLALALKTQDRIRGENLPNMRPNQFAAAYKDLNDTAIKQRKTIADVQQKLLKYQKAASDESGNAKLLSGDLQKANLLAGLVAVTGPGVVVTLRDSTHPPARPADVPTETYNEILSAYSIHDRDIQMVVNELKAAGAEAIAVNDQRVVAMTPIRCVGPQVNVNGVATDASPVRIKAIGDPNTLSSGLSLAGGVKDQFLADSSMFAMDKVKNLTLPAFAGATSVRFARPAADSKTEEAQRKSEEAGKPASDTSRDNGEKP